LRAPEPVLRRTYLLFCKSEIACAGHLFYAAHHTSGSKEHLASQEKSATVPRNEEPIPTNHQAPLVCTLDLRKELSTNPPPKNNQRENQDRLCAIETIPMAQACLEVFLSLGFVRLHFLDSFSRLSHPLTEG